MGQDLRRRPHPRHEQSRGAAYDIRYNGQSAYIYFPGYDTPENCSLTVTPVLTEWSRQAIAVRVPYTGGYWSRFNTTEGGRVVAVPVDVVLHC